MSKKIVLQYESIWFNKENCRMKKEKYLIILVIKNLKSSYLTKNLRDYGTTVVHEYGFFAFFFLAHSFMNRF